MNPEPYLCVITVQEPEVPMLYLGDRHVIYDRPMRGPVSRMQEMVMLGPWAEWVIFMHDDVEVADLSNWWSERTAGLPSNTAIIGLGGATGIGSPDLYKVPYKLSNLARTDYASAQRDWQMHGRELFLPTRVAVVDGFFLAIRWSFLQETGGLDWLLEGTRFHCYDLALCLEAYRRGWEVWSVPEPCFHRGGGTSCSPAYNDWCIANNTTQEQEHERPHRWLAKRYADILPFRV